MPKITCIDTGFVQPNFTATYLLTHGKEAAFFDTGVAASTPSLLEALRQDGLAPENVVAIIVSHVHLDHAGGAGTLMTACPNARLIVHPRGARHMVDPGKLEASAREVYGDEEFERSYGRLTPVADGRVTIAEDGFEWHWGTSTLTFRDAPGHAKHHLIAWDPDSRTVLAGDAFGLCYPKFPDLVLPTTSPTQFDPEAALMTYQMILELQPKQVAIGHFGFVDQLVSHGTRLKDMLIRHTEIARMYRQTEEIEGALAELIPPETRASFSIDLHMNALGLHHWIQQTDR